MFQIQIPYCAENYFPGLELNLISEGYIVGGSFDNWDRACYALLNTDSPHDCCEIYRAVHHKLSSFGYTMRGTKTTNSNGFYLR